MLMVARLTASHAWKGHITRMVAVVVACMLTTCASSVTPGTSPRSPEDLLALVKRLADSGRLNDPESVASMLGTALTLDSHRTYRFRGCEIENVSYHIPRYYLHWDWLAQHPIISAGRPIEPEPFRPRITAYKVELRKACGDKPAQTEANLTFSNINHWNSINFEKVVASLGRPSRVQPIIDVFNTGIFYDSIKKNAFYEFMLLGSSSLVFEIYIEQSDQAK